ncbi:hydroxymethylbilane synthase [Caldicellulosiruptoraceae bacterium PP1]
MKIRLATRKSALAQIQTNLIINKLRQRFDISCEKIFVQSYGDRNLDTFDKINMTGVFTKELENALLSSNADAAVHSFKDLPVNIDNRFDIVATPIRDDPRDVFLTYKDVNFYDLKEGSRIGTSSRRRIIQLNNIKKGIEFIPIRGNIHTRINKIKELNLDGIIISAAAIKRLDLWEYNLTYFDCEEVIPAAGQGIICVEILKYSEYRQILTEIDDNIVHQEADIEKDILKRLGGGCSSPIGVYCKINHNNIKIIAMIEKDGVIRKYSVNGQITDRDLLIDEII